MVNLPQVVVHKFGGSSVADAACMRRVADVVESDSSSRVLVVVSALKGVTDRLFDLVAAAERPDADWSASLAELQTQHQALINELVPDAALANPLIQTLEADVADLTRLLHSVRLVHTATAPIRDRVVGYGELWSSQILSAFLQQRQREGRAVQWWDARRFLTVEWQVLGPVVEWASSQRRFDALDALVPSTTRSVLVLPGFVANTLEGVQTTLGRNGSDYSASIIGALARADEIVIWTDVDGVLSADPRRVANARVIARLSYQEAIELAYFGAKVIHPQTMTPAIERAIPIRIKNTFNPSAAGSVIAAETDARLPVKGITTIEPVALINVEGTGMIGVPGTAQRLFGALREAGVSVILISQGSSEHSICIAVHDHERTLTESAIDRAFAQERSAGLIAATQTISRCAILAVVGDGMAGQSGVAAKVFKTLGDAAINIRAIAQGSSERNISLVIDEEQAKRALNVVHSAFYLSAHTVSIGLIGPGLVGQALLEQIESQRARLMERYAIDLRVRALAGSQRMALTEADFSAEWVASPRARLTHDGEALDLKRFTQHVNAPHLPHALIIDCSASSEVAAHYESWLSAGIHVVTPNKKANSGPYEAYARLTPARRKGGSQYYYEATVGAGLPIIQTLYDLRETGDEIVSIEGIFSGTLAYLFNVYDGTVPFSDIVKDAKAKGFTEPDPRDDLSGTDVARKLTILAREIGLPLELGAIRLESLVPESLVDVSMEAYLAGMSKFDEAMQKRYQQAVSNHKVLRYVGRLTAQGEASVGLLELEKSHPFAHIALTDNIIRFATKRYSQNPLIVQGPGAGPHVTAGGVFGDVLRLCVALGARL